MREIPYINLKVQHQQIKDELIGAFTRVLDHANFVLGHEVEQFEQEMAGYCGAKYAVGVNSGTDALFLCLKAYGVGPGDEVITAPNSFLASASAIVACGARPIFVDVMDDLNINPELIEEKISSKTRAIIPVHLTGKPAEMRPIMEVAKKHNLKVIEDAAQAIGAEYGSKKTGALGDAGCFSLHPLKTLNACGDGGVITTDDEELYQILTQLRNIGLKNRNESDIWGYNSRLDTIQAAFLSIKLKYLEQWIKERRKNAKFYTEQLAGIVKVPEDAQNGRSTYHTYVIQTETRDELQEYLHEHGIGTKIHYPIPIHLQKAAKQFGYKAGDYPMSEKLAGTILSLPVYQGLTEADLKYVVNNVSAFFGGKPAI